MFSPKSLFLSLVLVLSTYALFLSGQSSATIHEVSITAFSFVPQTDTIAQWDSVRWINKATQPHTTTSNTGLWDSGILNPGQSFTFQFDKPGSYPYHCEIDPNMTGTIVIQLTGVEDETENRGKPTGFAISQNYPNPFNQSTKIEFNLANSGFVSLNIYDLLGRKIQTLVNQHLSWGYKSVLWDGKDNSGNDVASGIYFYRLKVGDFCQTKKLVLLK